MMGRIRTIKPEFPESESIGRLSRDARLLFVLLWTFVDDSGRARASSRLLASRLYPYDEDAADLIDGWLDELHANGHVRLYEVEGNTYLDIPKWLKHQKIDRPSASRFPQFDEGSSKAPRDLAAHTLDLGPSTLDLGPKNIGANAPHSSQADRQGDQLKPGFAEPITLKPNETNDRHRFDGDQPITPRPETGIPASPMPAGFGRQEAECPGGHHAEQAADVPRTANAMHPDGGWPVLPGAQAQRSGGDDGTALGMGPEVLTGRVGDLLAPTPAGGPSGGNGKARRACDDARDAWNAAASRCGWPCVQRFSEARQKALTARLAEIGGIEGWATMLEKAEASDFLSGRSGRTDGHANWTMNFDWATKPVNLTKIMEGNYDNKSPGAPAANGHGTSAGFAAAASLLRDKVYSGL